MKTLLITILLSISLASMGQSPPHRVYLIPGQGADGRLFQGLSLPGYDTVILSYLIPLEGEGMAAYAQRMAAQIDTTQPFSLIGVSLGGMVAVEMTKILHPQHCIIISSAKGKAEIPPLYRFFSRLPLYKWLPGKVFITSTRLLQPFYEPMDPEAKALFHAMLREKDPRFMKRAIQCIVEWENEQYPEQVVHIHGTDDHTLPIRHVQPDIVIEGGTHMMTLLEAEKLSQTLIALLES